MEKLTLTLTLVLTVVTLSLTDCMIDTSEKSKELLKYSVLKEELYDKPIKTQITIDILIEDKEIDRQKINDLLKYFYDKTIKRSGFEHHDHPTNIFIYAYTSKDKAESGMGQWIGVVSKSHDDQKPKIDISETQINALSDVRKDRWGLTQEQRQKIWDKSIRLEDKAQKEADKKHPLDKLGITQGDIEKNVDLMEKLNKKYENELAKEYGIEIVIIDSIGIEGINKGWAFPK